MNLVEFMKRNKNESFDYVGQIFGPDSFTATGAEIAEMLEELGDSSDMIDHPATNNISEEGFYTESFSDVYHSDGELVFCQPSE